MTQSIGRGTSFVARVRDTAAAKQPKGIASKVGAKNTQEAVFVLILGLLLSLNSGYINGLCLSGMVGPDRQSVSAFTGTYTKSGLALAAGDPKLFGFEFTLILSFIGGAIVSGAMNPQAIPHKLVPTYGPTFLLGSIFMIASAIFGVTLPDGRALYYFAAMANGLQNGMTSTYSANLIRTSHLTGTSTDIGLIAGQMLRGNKKNYWKFKVLVGLAASFWLGGLISFYSAQKFLSQSLWFSAALYLLVGMTHCVYVVLSQRVSFIQAMTGTWKWEKVLETMASSMNPEGGGLEAGMTDEQIDRIFKTIDTDASGTIDADELKTALDDMGMKLSEQCVASMLKVVDENGDGVVDILEFRTLVNIATERAKFKKEKKMTRKVSIFGRKASISQSSLMAGQPSAKLSETSGTPPSIVEEEETIHEGSSRLPRTLDEALPPRSNGNADDRAIVVTEAKHPFAVVGCNKPWEDLCGFNESEAVGEPMSNLIQGPKTNREGLKKSMEELIGGADYVECETINYRKDGSTFKNFLQMGPLYDDNDEGDEEKGEREVAYFYGILRNIGELAQSLTDEDW
eukprot:CAMPEP_0201716630 /NCGR_PEP_ID=MMETSP0593-20130828/2563_1 /ASSEMBLY_ACC=CAM_ASM_000672 /TAXON_ID=267983 /ORGANISM="Skeletonema japonicum, Strain CCMP2506" /LENGTH=569 /DNA_ID=CAMNT_0048206477 /DNA_START=65 /DNA_END=1771 /DNA_ORIENTATION=+